MLTWAIEFIAFFALWTLFVMSLAMGELLTGAAVAGIAVVAFEAVKRAEPLCFEPPLRALAQIWRVPGLIASGTWVLLVELLRRILGHRRRSLFQLTPFRAAGADCRSAAKRALVIFYVTLPPNFLVIGIDRKSKLLLYHQVRKDAVPQIVPRLESA